MKYLLILICLLISTSAHARVDVSGVTVSKITVADGYLQIDLSTSVTVETCPAGTKLVYPDTGKYFEAYLSLATTALVSGRELTFKAGAPCLNSSTWPQISVMTLK